jgi:glycerol kinase
MMKSSANVNLTMINADGGATRNRFLMQFIADMTGLEVTAARIPDCSPLGAAMAGMLCTGLARSMDELRQLPRETVTYHPTMPASEVERLYTGWQRAVKQVLAGASDRKRT